MSHTLYLRLPPGAAAGTPLEWALLAADGTLDSSGRGDLPTASRVVAFVPGSEVSIATAELPTRSAARALQLAPFALEEQLAGDVEDLHFAAGPVDDAGRTAFVICERAAMERWLETLATAGVSPNCLSPDFLAVPDNPGHTVLWLEGAEVVVRNPGEWPILLDADPLASALEVAGVLGRETAPHVMCYATAAAHEAQTVALGAVEPRMASWRTQLLADGSLAALAMSAHHAPPLNLLQGDYASRGASRGELHRWRLPLALAAALLLVTALGQGVEYWRAKTEARRLDGLIADAAHQAMPDVHKLVDPRRQVEAKLAQSGGAAPGAAGLMKVMEALAATRETAPQLEIDNLNYFDGTADLQVKVPDASALESVRGALAARGFTVQVQAVPGAAGAATAARMRLSMEGASP